MMNRLVRYKAFQKLTISYFLLVLLTVGLLSTVLFHLFSGSAVKEIDRNSKAMLSQVSYASDVVYNQVMTMGSALLIRPEVAAFLNDKVEDKTNNYHIFRQMSQMIGVYPYIHSVGIYRPSTGSAVDTAGLPFDPSISMLGAEGYMEFYPRSIKIAHRNNDEPLRLLTFLLYPEFSFQTSDNPLIYINVEEKSILTTIRRISKADSASNVFVIDKEGRVLSHTDPALFLEDLSGEDYIQRILNQGEEENSFTSTIQGKKNLVTYVKSEEMDWYFVSVFPYSGLISNIDRLRNVTLLVTCGIVLAGLLTSILLSRSIYRPLSTLLEKLMPAADGNPPDAGSAFVDEYKMMTEVFQSLEEKEKTMQFVINRSSRTIREHYLHSLLRGQSLAPSLPGELIRDIEEKAAGPYFGVLVFRVDKPQAENAQGRFEAKQQPLLRFAIGNIAKEMLEPVGPCDYLIMEENEAAAILQYEHNRMPEELEPVLRGIQQFLHRYFKLTVSIGVGDIGFGRKTLSSSYTSAQQYVKYRLIYGKEAVLDAAATRPHLMNALSYPAAYEQKLIDAVQSGRPDRIREAIGQFVEQLSTGSISQVVAYSTQLMLSLLKYFDYLQHVPDSNFNEYLDAVTDIESAEYLTEIEEIFDRYCANLRALIEEKNLWMNAQKHNIVIEKVQNHIQEHYAEPNLSLELVSSIAGLSPSYLGKLFKSAAGQSFSEYLSHTRLEKARELLSSTPATAAKISESVGIYNTPYFSTLFKKKYGLTPSAFREQEAMREAESAGE
ncbi:helix-turn-helix domain-containing protein [Saccharibacillus sp. CPCC 101409]|uniref:helix-turn-helix domain-containing protein n=1 Tax=Saccharibacillus sp. CPCC 101409 TaxID=3058041 RepID=UPI002673C88F|nr:helix-turn-helix domain-containing protein [Saccharibacillus sp. CPCC 101409]MDO3408642.1 helix-turn-helix domain-containing protein [Saccharibacillus sp. CPCC 101409]